MENGTVNPFASGTRITKTSRATAESLDRVLLLATYGVECAVVVSLIALHRLGGRPIVGSLHSITRLALVGSAVIAVLALGLVVWRLARPGPLARRSQILTVMLNLITVGSLLVLGEVTVRAFSERQGDVRVFLGTTLMPRRWDEVAARYQRVIREAMSAGELSYISYDDRLGWSLTPGRASDDGLYFNSAEGIRSPEAGLHMLGTKATPGTPTPYRIGLIGDSHTFGQDVRYDDTWGYQLERLLGPCVEVRNFGVPGYGVDQAVLRYERHVRPWAPQLAILAPIGNDFERTMLVYMFLNFPGWDYPFSKPRFALREGTAVLLNSPTIPPAAIFSRERVFDLPLIEYDIAFDPADWRFHPYDHSLLIRWLGARFRAWHTASDATDGSMNQAEVNRAILRRFLDMARADSVVPLLAYLPSTLESKFPTATPNMGRTLIAEIAAEAGVLHTDLTHTLRAVDPGRLASNLGYGIHYSPEANGAIAEHLAGLVLVAMGGKCGT